MSGPFVHTPEACRRCERVPPDAPRRHWKCEPKAGAWHVIADGPDLMARLPRPAHFVTVLSYRPAADAPHHYCGPLYFEFDSDRPEHALQDLRRCTQTLEVEYDCPAEALHFWHSGRRGFHAILPPIVIGAEAGHPQLPRIHALMIARLFPQPLAPILDRRIYSGGQGRMWRLPNRRRSDTGRYKVPLAVREVLHTPYAELEALTARPRKGLFWPADADLTPCPALVELYHQAMAAVGSSPRPRPPLPDGGRIPEGQRNSTLASLAGSMRRRGASEAAIAAALMAENRRCDPPLDAAEVRSIAASIAQYAPAVAAAGSGRGTRSQPFRTIPVTEVTAWRA